MADRPALSQTPAPTPQIVVMPQTGAPMRSAVEEASAAARERIAAGQSAIPVEHHSTTQPRVGAGNPAGGEFVRSTIKELPNPQDGGPNPSGNPAPAAGRDSLSVDPGAPPGDDQAIGDQPPEGQGIAETAAEDELQPEGEEAPPEGEPDPLLVKLPGREEGDDFEIQVDSPEAAERLRQLKNGYMRGNAVRAVEAEATSKLEEAQNVRAYAESDPVGFVLEACQAEPSVVDHLVLSLLTQPDVARRLGPVVAKVLSDEKEFRTVAAEQKAQRSEAKITMQTRLQEQREVEANFRDVQATVGAILPTNLPPERLEVIRRDVMRDLKEYADRYDLLTIPVHDIPTILTPRLKALGINPVEAAQRAANPATRTARVAPRQPVPGAAPQTPRTPAPARANGTKPNGQRFVASSAARAAARIPGAGAGSPGAGALEGWSSRNPDGTIKSTEQVIKEHRERVNKGQRAY